MFEVAERHEAFRHREESANPLPRDLRASLPSRSRPRIGVSPGQSEHALLEDICLDFAIIRVMSTHKSAPQGIGGRSSRGRFMDLATFEAIFLHFTIIEVMLTCKSGPPTSEDALLEDAWRDFNIIQVTSTTGAPPLDRRAPC